jgi:nickel-dependent lactate racemase
MPFGASALDVTLAGAGVQLLVGGPPAPGPAPTPGDLCRRALSSLPEAVRSPLLLVPDRTRDAQLHRLLPPLLEQLRERGVRGPVPCLFASGTHRPMSDAEMVRALGPARDELRPLAHDCDGAPFASLGPGPDGEDVRLHAALLESDACIALSAMSLHYLAGFGGGRKMLLPGIADRATATAIHATCLRREPPGRHPRAVAGMLAGNPLHEGIVARLGGLPPLAGVTVVVDDGRIVDGEAGELLAHHEVLARRYAEGRRVLVDAPLDGLLLGCGGAPRDVDLVQAHKSLTAVAPILAPGARVAWLAELPGGLGHDDLTAWCSDGGADAQLRRLLDDFHIGRQTAWSLRSLLDRFEVALTSSFDDERVRELGASPLDSDELSDFLAPCARVGVAPHGAARIYELADDDDD